MYAINTANMCQLAVRQFADVADAMTCVERVMAYAKLKPQPGYNIRTLPPVNWPNAGNLSFRDISLRYYPGGPQVLKHLTFDIPEKQEKKKVRNCWSHRRWKIVNCCSPFTHT